VVTAFISEPRHCTRSVHPECSLLRKRKSRRGRRRGVEDWGVGSIGNTVSSLTPETEALRSLSFREQVEHSAVYLSGLID